MNNNAPRPERLKLSTPGRINKLRTDAVARNRNKRGLSDSEAQKQADAWLADIITRADDLSDGERAECLAQVNTPFDWEQFYARRVSSPSAVVNAKPAAPLAAPMFSSESLHRAFKTSKAPASKKPAPVKPRELNIPDEEPEPTPLSRDGERGPSPHRSGPRGEKPLTTEGHLTDLVERFKKRFVDQGHSRNQALRKAVNKARYLVDQDKSLSDEDYDRLVGVLEAILSPPRPPFTSETLRRRFEGVDNTLHLADRLIEEIRHDTRLTDAEKAALHSLIDAEVHHHFLKPLLRKGGSTLEAIDDATKQAHEWMGKRLEPRRARPQHDTRGQRSHFTPLMGNGDAPAREHRAKVTSNATELSPEDQAQRRADKRKKHEERERQARDRRNDPHFGEMRRAENTGGKKKDGDDSKKKRRKKDAQANA